ncbi:MAG: DUF3786 domain-containing protein [Planctomycetota bacterium]|jgi:hypothetical protein
MDLERSHGRFWDDIVSRTVETAAHRAGAEADGPRILVPMVGRRFAVDPGERTVREEDPAEGWKETGFLESVVLLSYLATADGFPASGEWVSEKGLTHGDAYFRPPHEMPTARLAERFGVDPDGFVRAAEALGGEETSQGDRGIEIPALPRVPIRFNLWLGDEEFPDADVRTLFDRNATHYLILDGVLALTNLAVKALLNAGGP